MVRATPSNCGKFLKPTATKLAPKGASGRGNDLGYGNSAEDTTMDNPQPSPKLESRESAFDTDAVQRLNGGGSHGERFLRTSAGLKI